MDITRYLERRRAEVDKAIRKFLPPHGAGKPSGLHDAMRYAVLSGGKRVRPVLALAACEAVGGRARDVMPAACAIEFIHSYSLVHDDLPCMDDDDERRGSPTCHRKFGEDTALLAGDALLTLAFTTLASPTNGAALTTRAAARRLEALRRVADAAGVHGMVGGQAVDMAYQGREPDLPTLEYINTHKSGALIAVSAEVGAYLGGGTLSQVRAIHRYGRAVGLLFQIVDDILDREGYAKLIGVPEARKEAQDLLAKAKKYVEPFGGKGRALAALADFVFMRTY